jgi:hypothetical protein
LILSAIFITTSVLIPWRCKCNYRLMRIVIQKIRIKKKDPENIFMIVRGIGSNFAYLFLDFGLLFSILLYALTSVLVIWRIKYSYDWYVENVDMIK